ncbi:MAG: transcriptional repressor [Anaerolinea sp.]|nr:transcriptional repressor [Anaerolinea sp.]
MAAHPAGHQSDVHLEALEDTGDPRGAALTPLGGRSYDRNVPGATQETIARLEGQGHRVTGSRRAVLDAIAGTVTPFTVEDICLAAPDVGRATVFRTVKLLQDLDVVCRLPLGDGGVRYQLSQSEHHHHLICESCGAVSEFSDPELDALIRRNARREGFRLDGHSLELYGLCPACQPGG